MVSEWASLLGDDHEFTGRVDFFHRPVRLDDVVDGRHRACVYFRRACFDGVHEGLKRRVDEVLGSTGICGQIDGGRDDTFRTSGPPEL